MKDFGVRKKEKQTVFRESERTGMPKRERKRNSVKSSQIWLAGFY